MTRPGISTALPRLVVRLPVVPLLNYRQHWEAIGVSPCSTPSAAIPGMGLAPYSGLTGDAAGNLYGMTLLGGGANSATTGVGWPPNKKLYEISVDGTIRESKG